MKKILKDKIINIENTNIFDNKFLFEYLEINKRDSNIEIIYLSDLLELKKNIDILEKVNNKPAMYSNVYSPEDELEIFKDIFDNALKNKKRVHIVWVTLDSEIKILEEYYRKLWFMRDDINCFDPDFSIPLVTVSVKIENIIWKWSDYKVQRSNIFFNPPIRESGQVKAMYKWINRWVVAWIYITNYDKKIESFLWNCILEEKILPLTLTKVLNYNLSDIWFTWIKKELIINY